MSDQNCGGSFIKMSANEVANRANTSLKKIKESKQRSIQNLIDLKKEEILKARELKKNSLWCKIFGYTEKPMPTDEEILANMENPKSGDYLYIDPIYWIDMRYVKYERVAYRLLTVASSAEEVYVSADDLYNLL